MMDLALIPSGSDPLGRYTLSNDFYMMSLYVAYMIHVSRIFFRVINENKHTINIRIIAGIL